MIVAIHAEGHRRVSAGVRGRFFRASARLVVGALLAASFGCGYTAAGVRSTNTVQAVIVEPVRSSAIAVDASIVDTALRRAVSRAPGLVLTATAADALRLRVRARFGTDRLSALSEPRVRAGRYDTQVTLQGEAVDAEGQTRWRGFEVGRAPYLSTPGGIESLDGAGRRALDQAARQAAERLVRSLAADLE